jgi:hypothetical protein
MYSEIPEDLKTAAWKYAQLNFTPANQWQGYFNYLGQALSRLWLASINGDRSLDQRVEGLAEFYADFHRWEFVNGSPIEIGEHRLCLIPHTNYDRSELRVPCEWVEIPDWIADYYLAIQFDPDKSTATIWSYTTHHQLQQLGVYDDLDRTYCMDGDDLMQDLSILPLALHTSPPDRTRGDCTDLKSISLTEAERYLKIWSDPNLSVPRLDIQEADFSTWLAMIADDRWSRKLYHQRLGDRELVLEAEFS